MNAVVQTSALSPAHLLVTVATTFEQRLAVTSRELGRSQVVLCQASDALMISFRAAVAAIKPVGFDQVHNHLDQACRHLQSHDLVNHLIEVQKCRVDGMRTNLREAIALADNPAGTDRSQTMLDCIIVGIDEIDAEMRAPSTDSAKQGSVALF